MIFVCVVCECLRLHTMFINQLYVSASDDTGVSNVLVTDSVEPNQFPLPIMLAFSNKTNITGVLIHVDSTPLQSVAPHN